MPAASAVPLSWASWLADEKAQRVTQSLWREKQPLDSAQSTRVLLQDQWLHNFCSNDYLGLANDDELKTYAQQALAQHGVGAGSATLVCGHHREHQALQEELADWLGVESVLLFGSGYMANMGVLTALLGKGDAVFQDRLNHASLLDGGLASGARQQRYIHNDCADLARRLVANTARRTLIASDGVFSMDGDIAPVAQLQRLAAQHDALLLLDEAHAFGVIGDAGRGSVSVAGLDSDAVALRIGTLGKAFGGYGAFVAGPKDLIDMIQQLARPAIYTTALPPAWAATMRKSLQLVQGDDWRRQRLTELIKMLRQGLQQQGWSLLPSSTPIQPVLVGSAQRALDLAHALRQRGFLVSAIRPPTVPLGTARLRITLSAGHDPQAVSELLAAMAGMAKHFNHE
ncbi:MAG: 8-amino-7-oxononanoate synthase [Moraxellaceae bacterium]|nr:8-amino-7-oxononanoate synthase [Moraxellaceae bacterium]